MPNTLLPKLSGLPTTTQSLANAHKTIRQGILRQPTFRLTDMINISYSAQELAMATLLDRTRPPSLRRFDQIPINACDHIRQIKTMAPYLAGQSVVFVGDSDCASLLFGLYSTIGGVRPAHMLLMDFDNRLLTMAQEIAKEYSFDSWFETRAYNVFEPLPLELINQFDWFYTNPPYGQYNKGESARLFITRGCELTRPGGKGCLLLPDDEERQWTGDAMYCTQQFLSRHGWFVKEKINGMHGYHLDDDQSLMSATMLIKHSSSVNSSQMPYAERKVSDEEIPNFYGRNVHPPYPHYVQDDGSLEFGQTLCEVNNG